MNIDVDIGMEMGTDMDTDMYIYVDMDTDINMCHVSWCVLNLYTKFHLRRKNL
jgi:hypothetical protein